ncbi:MAG TPA: Ig-like domain-containing protein [Lacipirellulaceae bacterium]|nr:Ig-like domain-containing protein [Lacipirellulaceae bacterium]
MFSATRTQSSVNQFTRRPQRRSFALATLALTAAFFAVHAAAAEIPVPNGDFSNAGNIGQVGGGVLGGSGFSLIGSGPWSGTYQGILALLAPPVLSINSGSATISGLAGVSGVGIVDNSGYFSQDLTTAYAPTKRYVLNATVDANTPLNVGLLSSAQAGIALTRGTTELASTRNATLLELSLLSGTSYKLTLVYETGATASGNIGVKLFSNPQNLLTANLLSSVSFSNVTLHGGPINAPAASIGPASGTPQSAIINTGFGSPLTVEVFDSEGDGVPGVTVAFAAPTSGASTTLSASTVVTDANGLAQVTGLANGVPGDYTVTATVGSLPAASFTLTNVAPAGTNVGNAVGTPQSATVTMLFGDPLGVTVTDGSGHAVAGTPVNFQAPLAGATATFPDGLIAFTDINGHASVTARANSVAGSYVVTASVPGGATSAAFALTNDAGAVAIATPFSGTPQRATVLTAFDTPLSVRLTDIFGNAKAGLQVAFTAPVSGPSATFPPNGTSTMVVTDADGFATIDAMANANAGSYLVAASSDGLLTDVDFLLTNTNQPLPNVVETSGENQVANVATAFECLLQIKITDAGGTPVSGANINFSAPLTGPSATLSNGSASGITVTASTDSAGLAGVTATANSVPGSYAITATMQGDETVLGDFTLTNLDAGDIIFKTGGDFEVWPALCPTP